MRNVFVQCKCDVCGREAVAASEFNPWHHLYEETLPSGWRQFDNEQFPWVDFSGDQCAECQSSFFKHMEVSFNRWRKYVMTKSNFGSLGIQRTNDDGGLPSGRTDGG
jgi:hypothetical protein